MYSERRLVAPLIALLAVVALAVFSAAGCSSPSNTIVVVTEADEGTTLSVAKGEALSVQLPANPSTGFSWVATSTPQFLAAQGESTFESSANGSVVGAGGTQTNVFKVTAAGKGELIMEYLRPWETGVAPAKTFRVKIESE